MNRQKTLKIVFPLLCVIAAFVWFFNLKETPTKTRSKGIELNEVEELVSLVKKYKKGLKEGSMKREVKVQSVRNPFFGVVTVSKGTEEVPLRTNEYILNAIMRNNGVYVAIINSQEVSTGQSIGSYVVKEILDEKVILTNGSEMMELNM